jgi:DNA polymerase (family X)
MSNAELARRLDQLADLSEIDGDNPFRVRAYRNAARRLRELEEQISDLLDHGADLTEIEGIGKEIAEKLRTMVQTGRLRQLDELAERVPIGLTEVVRVKGVGPKHARTLWQEVGVTDVDELEKAAKDGKLAGLPGFGAKTQENVLKGIDAYRRNTGRALLGEIDAVVAPLIERLRTAKGVSRVEVAGSYRRRRETVGDVDLLAIAASPGEVTKAFTSYGEVDDVLGSGDTRSSVRLASGLQVDLRVVPEDAFGAALMYFTGSKDHNVALRQRAIDRGLRLNEYGLFEGTEDDPHARRVAGISEEEIYQRLGLAWVPPELREDRGEIAAAAEGRLPELLTQDDLHGDLHMHSTWSDGKNTLSEMIAACIERGYAYMAITDHSKALAMTGGMDEAKLARQWEELDALTADRSDITVLRGMEVDILKDGSLDLSDDWLEKLDIVLVSVHSHFGLPQTEQTARVVKAVSHPEVNVLAHPTARMLGERDPIDVDLGAVFDACLENDVAVEHNASVPRLDLSDTHMIAARKRGLVITMGTDAHAVKQLDAMRFGVDQARRAWLTREDVLNTRPLAEVRRFLAKRKR